MITATLDSGETHSAVIDGAPRYVLIAAAVLAGVACVRRDYLIAAMAGVFGLLVAGTLWVLTWRALHAEHMTNYARPGWAFIAACSAAVLLMTLPFWATARRSDRVSVRVPRREDTR